MPLPIEVMMRDLEVMWFKDRTEEAEREIREAEEEMRLAAKEEYAVELEERLYFESARSSYNHLVSTYSLKQLSRAEAKRAMGAATQKLVAAMRRLDDLKLGYITPPREEWKVHLAEFVACEENYAKGNTSDIIEPMVQCDTYDLSTNDVPVVFSECRTDVNNEEVRPENDSLGEVHVVPESLSQLLPMDSLDMEVLEDLELVNSENLTHDVEEIDKVNGQVVQEEVNYFVEPELIDFIFAPNSFDDNDRVHLLSFLPKVFSMGKCSQSRWNSTFYSIVYERVRTYLYNHNPVRKHVYARGWSLTLLKWLWRYKGKMIFEWCFGFTSKLRSYSCLSVLK